MTVEVGEQKVAREALNEMQRYLSDQIAPMMAADAAQELLRMPAKYGVAAIESWLEGQLRAPNQAVTVSRYLFHAVKKFQVFSEFKLIDPQAMDRYVAELSRLVVRICPERERVELRLKLSRIGEVRTTLADPVRLLNREMGDAEQEQSASPARAPRSGPAGHDGGQPAALPVSPYRSKLMERLEELQDSDDQDSKGPEAQEVLARLVGRAAVEAGDTPQFDAALESIRKLGIDPKFDRVFRLLGKRLPGWDVDSGQARPGANSALGRLLQAMHQIVALAGTREEGIERFSEMLYTAIEQFNEGHLAQAVAMFDVAQRLIEDEKVDVSTAGLVRSRAESSLSTASFRQFASTPSKNRMLRKVLSFFPSYTPDSLLKSLDGEPKREKRKLMLSLLEVHGPACRPVLLERLSAYLSGDLPDDHGFYSRNIVFLLRRISLTPDDDQTQELRLLSEFSRPERPFMITKEAVGGLAHLSLPKTGSVLIDRLEAFEAEALSGASDYGPEELLEILDRTCAALALLGTPEAIRAVVDHVFRTEPELGQTLRRSQHLAVCDFIRNQDELVKLVERLRKLLPARVLGVVVGRRIHEVPYLIRALSGASDPSVRRLFEEIVQRFPDQEFEEPAREALAASRVEPVAEGVAPQELSGDLEIFGLPTLLQSIAGSELSGRLLISERNGSDRAVIHFSSGKILRCEVGRLRGLDAMCQLFERPRPATFRFEKATENVPAPIGEGVMDVMSTILEAMRRHDEFHEARAIVPDGVSLMPSRVSPSIPRGETDKSFAQAVWREAARGTAPESCEGAVTGDAYRVRKLYAHWLECGSLKRRPAA